ncbi:MAG: hypothetical protein Q7S26_03690 [bacterium]|nr:hypothetical protein [bacterium]
MEFPEIRVSADVFSLEPLRIFNIGDGGKSVAYRSSDILSNPDGSYRLKPGAECVYRLQSLFHVTHDYQVGAHNVFVDVSVKFHQMLANDSEVIRR